jgi:hypothetical protein
VDLNAAAPIPIPFTQLLTSAVVEERDGVRHITITVAHGHRPRLSGAGFKSISSAVSAGASAPTSDVAANYRAPSRTIEVGGAPPSLVSILTRASASANRSSMQKSVLNFVERIPEYLCIVTVNKARRI